MLTCETKVIRFHSAFKSTQCATTCRRISKWVLLTVHQQHTHSCFMAAIDVNALCGGGAVCHDYRCRGTNPFGPCHHSPRLVNLTVFRCQQQLHSAIGSRMQLRLVISCLWFDMSSQGVDRFQVAPQGCANLAHKAVQQQQHLT